MPFRMAFLYDSGKRSEKPLLLRTSSVPGEFPRKKLTIADIFFRKNSSPDGWTRDLTQEGIHPHPGPVHGCLQLWTIIVKSATGAWRVLEYAATFKEPLVIALQEINICIPQNLMRLVGLAGKMASECFRLFDTHGTPSRDGYGHDKPRGGVAWLVDQRIPSQDRRGLVINHSQVHCIFCGLFRLFNLYSPPVSRDSQMDSATGFADFVIGENIDLNQLWVAVGDHNETPDKSTI